MQNFFQEMFSTTSVNRSIQDLLGESVVAKKRCKSSFETAHSALLKLGGMPEDVGRFSKDCLPEATA